MHTAPAANSMNAPAGQTFVAEGDLALFAALIGRKPMSKTLRQSISEQAVSEDDTDAPLPRPVMMQPVAAPASGLALDRRHRMSVWIAAASSAAMKRLVEARSRLDI